MFVRVYGNFWYEIGYVYNCSNVHTRSEVSN